MMKSKFAVDFSLKHPTDLLFSSGSRRFVISRLVNHASSIQRVTRVRPCGSSVFRCCLLETHPATGRACCSADVPVRHGARRVIS